MPRNETIINSPVVLLLGAGASASLDKPMMEAFVSKLLVVVEDSQQKELLSKIVSFRGKDLEAVLGELDTLIDLDYADTIYGQRGAIMSAGSKQTMIELAHAKALRSTLRDCIYREYSRIDGNSVESLYEPR